MELVTVLATLVIGKAHVCQNKVQTIDSVLIVIWSENDFVLKSSQNLSRKAKLIFNNCSSKIVHQM